MAATRGTAEAIPRRLVDSSNNHTDTYSLNAFGAEFASATGSTHNPYRYGGAWGYITDPSGMLQSGARFYWPEIGRFIQQDPVGDGINWYAYVGNNPVVWIDPMGLLKDYQHGIDTKRRALKVGLGKHASTVIGWWSYEADQHGDLSKRKEPHYGDQLGYAAQQFTNAKLLYRAGQHDEAYKALGYGAHAIQDFYAHSMPITDHVLLNAKGWDPDDPANYPCGYARSVDHLESYLGQFEAAITGRPYTGPIFPHPAPFTQFDPIPKP